MASQFSLSYSSTTRGQIRGVDVSRVCCWMCANLFCKDISPLEWTARKKHLVSLMYFPQQYEWSAVLNFHGSVSLEIERGLVKWGDPFLHLKSRALYGHPLQGNSPTSSSSAPVLFYRDYQREQCINVKDHFGFIRGERKWLRHICALCIVLDTSSKAGAT